MVIGLLDIPDGRKNHSGEIPLTGGLAVFLAVTIQRFLYLLVTYLMYIHVGKGLPTYCGIRAVGRQPFAANDKQSNQSTLKTLYAWKTMKLIRIVHDKWNRRKTQFHETA